MVSHAKENKADDTRRKGGFLGSPRHSYPLAQSLGTKSERRGGGKDGKNEVDEQIEEEN
jgi:hypothetical protein